MKLLMLALAVPLLLVTQMPVAEISTAVDGSEAADDGAWMCVGTDGPNPCRFDLNDVHSGNNWRSGEGDRAVGRGGIILRWSEPSWRREKSPTHADLLAVETRNVPRYRISDPHVQYGWAAGEGVILRLAGGSWTVDFAAPTVRFHDVAIVDDQRAFAAGETVGPDGHAVLFRLQDAEWAPMAIPSARRLHGVDVVSETDGWAVGEDAEGFSVIVHWDGHGWRLVDHPRVSGLKAVNAMWAAGGTSVLRWNGYEWYVKGQSESWDLIDLDMCASNNGFFVNRAGRDLIWSGSRFRELAVDETSFLAVDCRASWFVGSAGQMSLWDWWPVRWWQSGAWYPLHEPPASRLRDVAIVSGREAWAIGLHGGSAVVLRLSARDTTRQELPTDSELHAIAADGPDDAVAVGESGAIVEWDGRSWREIEPVTDATLRAVDIGPGGLVLATGDDGVLLERRHGEWRTAVGPLGVDWYGVSALSPSLAWAVGSDGAVARWDGGDWTMLRAAMPSQPDLRAVDVISEVDAWAAGDDGTMLRWDGQTWLAHETGVDEDFAGLSFVDSERGWAVTDGGSGILRWDGQVWRPEGAARIDGLRAIDASDEAQWVVGGAAALRYIKRLEPRRFLPIAGT